MLNPIVLSHFMSLKTLSASVIYPTSLYISKAYIGDFIFFQWLLFLILYIYV